MIKELNINHKQVNIQYPKTDIKELPVVILHAYNKEEGRVVFEKCEKLHCPNFILVSISNLDWNKEMTPWFAHKLNQHDEDFLGKADEYIEELTTEIIPKIEDYMKKELQKDITYYAIAGYSLGGLFAVYATYKTDIFKKVASASGSFWFPNFVEYIKENRMKSKVQSMYFSLGNKESKVRNQVLATVEEHTKAIENIYHSQGIETIYEENEGNHFHEADLRMAKGIKWILEEG